MARLQARFVCTACGSVQPRWAGQCPDCGAWNSLVRADGVASARRKQGTGERALSFQPLSAQTPMPARLLTGLSELDRALGGGLVAGSALLLAGEPGIGKSTLLLQMAGRIAQSGHPAAYVSGEEAPDQVRLRACRIGLAHAPVALAGATSVAEILAALAAGPPPALLVVDSIQTMYSSEAEGAPGTVSQVRASAMELVRFAKANGTALVLVGHVTKDGQIAGPRVLEHMVDTVLSFEGERTHRFRLLRCIKNRFGPTDEVGVFAMTGEGLAGVSDPSGLFLTDRAMPVSGSAVFPAMEGTRPMLVELEALTVRVPTGATPRRAVVGWDGGRLAMLLAVLEARAGLGFGGHEVYLSAAGGIRVSDPAADLAVAGALVSALFDSPIPAGTVLFGEVALSGEVRAAPHAALRLKEAEKLGFRRALVPEGVSGLGRLRAEPVPSVADLVGRLRAGRGGRARA